MGGTGGEVGRSGVSGVSGDRRGMLGRFLVRLGFTSQMAGHGIFANPLRSALTVLGVGIGVASVVSLMGIGEGARQAVAEQFQRLGANVIEIRAEDPENVHLDPDDADEILERVSGLTAATPVIRDTLPVKWRFTRGSVDVVGVGADYPKVRSQDLVSGHFFTRFHVDSRAKVAVVGYTIGRALLNGRSPVGHTIEISGSDYLIMGVLAPRGPDNEENVDEEILIPYTDALTLMGKEDADEIWAKADSSQDATLAVVQLGRIYKRKLGIDPTAPTTIGGGGGSESVPGGPGGEGGEGGGVGGGPVPVPPGKIGGGAGPGGAGGSPLAPRGKELISITNMNQMVSEADEANRVMTLLLGGIASVSLLVGGLGIMNIMLVAVSERTGEIGLRRAIGAKQVDLIIQFLLEALYLSGIGAIGGVAAGIWGTRIFSAQGYATVISLQAIEVAVGVALGAGLLFGVFPAISAAALQPVEALRRR